MNKSAFVCNPSAVLIGQTVALLLTIKFGTPAESPEIIAGMEAHMADLDKAGRLKGELVLVNGPALVMGGALLGHWLAHRFAAVAFLDPKLTGGPAYVVVASHGPNHKIGDKIAQSDVVAAEVDPIAE